MNVLAWNYRGTCSPRFDHLIKDFCKEYETTLLFLLETHASRDTTNKNIPRLGLNSHFIQDEHGQSGWIWSIWKFDMWRVKVIESDHQFFHMKVSWRKQNSWYHITVYRSPKLQQCRTLWESLISISKNVKGA